MLSGGSLLQSSTRSSGCPAFGDDGGVKGSSTSGALGGFLQRREGQRESRGRAKSLVYHARVSSPRVGCSIFHTCEEKGMVSSRRGCQPADLTHISAEVCEHHGSVRSGQYARQVKHFDSL